MKRRLPPATYRTLVELYDGIDRRRLDLVLADTLDELRAVAADWPSWARSWLDLLEATDTGSGGRGSGVSDPTAGAVARRETLIAQRDDVLQYLDDALLALKAARTGMGRVARTANAAAHQQAVDAATCCAGVGLPGGLEWGNPTCRELIVYPELRLCRSCYARRWRWMQRQVTA